MIFNVAQYKVYLPRQSEGKWQNKMWNWVQYLYCESTKKYTMHTLPSLFYHLCCFISWSDVVLTCLWKPNQVLGLQISPQLHPLCTWHLLQIPFRCMFICIHVKKQKVHFYNPGISNTGNRIVYQWEVQYCMWEWLLIWSKALKMEGVLGDCFAFKANFWSVVLGQKLTWLCS